ncbi:MAG: hypothetical protein LUG99_21045 [Lachnospiraceae bacterium]|nr:hypothetical protein [Lachnospiraceae bacterium]
MFQEEISEEYIVSQTGTSEGTQIKYKKGDYWYKKDRNGREGLAEYLASKLLTFTNLAPSEYVLYEQGTINGNAGCRSRNFLLPGEEFITLYRLYYNEFGRDLSAVTAVMETMEERVDYVLRYVLQSCGVNLSDYFKKIFTLDWIVLNEDRHFNNLGLVFGQNEFRPAPIFDNGVSLLTANLSVNWHFSVEENVRRVTAKPFCGSHEKMFRYFGQGFELDIAAAQEWIRGETPSRERDVLAWQLGVCQKIGC